MGYSSSEALSIERTSPAPLLVLLSEVGDVQTRVKAAETIGQTQPPGARAALIKALGDPEPEVRLAVVWALVALGDPDAVSALRSLAIDRSPLVRAAVAQALRVLQAEASGVRMIASSSPAREVPAERTDARFVVRIGSLVSLQAVTPSTLSALQTAVQREIGQLAPLGVVSGPISEATQRRVNVGELRGFRLQGGVRFIRRDDTPTGVSVQLKVSLAVIAEPSGTPVATLSGVASQEAVAGVDLDATISALEARAVAEAVRVALGDLAKTLAVAPRR